MRRLTAGCSLCSIVLTVAAPGSAGKLAGVLGEQAKLAAEPKGATLNTFLPLLSRSMPATR